MSLGCINAHFAEVNSPQLSGKRLYLELASRHWRVSTLTAIINSVNAHGSIQIEEHPPLTHLQSVQPVPIGESFNITLAEITVMRQCQQNSHHSVTTSRRRSAGRSPGDIQSPNSRSASRCGIWGGGLARAEINTRDTSGSTGTSRGTRNSRKIGCRSWRRTSYVSQF